MPSCNTYSLTWVSLTLDEGYLLTAAPPDLERGIAPLGPLGPMQPPLLGRVVAPLGHALCTVAPTCALETLLNHKSREIDNFTKKHWLLLSIS